MANFHPICWKQNTILVCQVVLFSPAEQVWLDLAPTRAVAMSASIQRYCSATWFYLLPIIKRYFLMGYRSIKAVPHPPTPHVFFLIFSKLKKKTTHTQKAGKQYKLILDCDILMTLKGTMGISKQKTQTFHDVLGFIKYNFPVTYQKIPSARWQFVINTVNGCDYSALNWARVFLMSLSSPHVHRSLFCRLFSCKLHATFRAWNQSFGNFFCTCRDPLTCTAGGSFSISQSFMSGRIKALSYRRYYVQHVAAPADTHCGHSPINITCFFRGFFCFW